MPQEAQHPTSTAQATGYYLAASDFGTALLAEFPDAYLSPRIQQLITKATEQKSAAFAASHAEFMAANQ